MKMLKFCFAATAVIAALLFSSCQKEQLHEPATVTSLADEPQLFTKEISLTDSAGKNKAIVRLKSADESLLDEVDFAKFIEIEPVFEAPSVENFEGKPVLEDVEGRPDIEIEIVDQQIEQGAVGLKLHFKKGLNDGIQQRAVTTLWFTTSFDRIKVVTWSGCTVNHYYKKLYYSSPFVWMASFNCCANFWSYAYTIPSYQMRVGVVYSNAGFTIYAW